ncbi:AMP-binding protein [Demequina sp. NBRC 110053]|uniref:AMP-binding enzyme n=1 Tax=Demequina sp. NBRC 110053 TaxID=1570342 RepID=UPI000A03B891|nr:AMP-binding protein [Demequina sp. NBRC 110053]
MTFARLADGPARAVAGAVAGSADGLVAPTSGSTGAPRDVLLPRRAIVASAQATLERLGGGGHWLLALPDSRIAGAMVRARALIADAHLAVMPDGPFTSDGFATAAAGMPPGPRYVSLVPTQVRRLLADPRGADALAGFDAVLVGGAPPGMALPPNAVETYGMTETCGGCVYDGTPLPGTKVAVGGDGRIRLGGPTLAAGYADGDDRAFETRDDERWFLTSDLGSWDGAALAVHGRADDVIITGGLNVHPTAVERALLASPEIADAVVTSVPDREWGERVAALVVLAREGATGATADAAGQVAGAAQGLGAHERPRFVLAVDAIPRTAAGKIDRSAARAIAASAAKEAP